MPFVNAKSFAIANRPQSLSPIFSWHTVTVTRIGLYTSSVVVRCWVTLNHKLLSFPLIHLTLPSGNVQFDVSGCNHMLMGIGVIFLQLHKESFLDPLVFGNCLPKRLWLELMRLLFNQACLFCKIFSSSFLSPRFGMHIVSHLECSVPFRLVRSVE